MSDNELKYGRIEAVIYASEAIINKRPDRETEILAKETAYEHIKKIIDGCCPWQENWGNNPYQE